ncbi:MAG: peptidoglycan DD-metalloendopeptidase family protein [Dermatophilaceae bacterium]|nr:peptidoglycan DD-metalloendopeptidase family protein [Dermatophilaceae bacterium]
MGSMSIGSALLAAAVAVASATGAAAATGPSTRPAAQGPLTSNAPPSQARWAWPLEPEPSVERRFDPPDQPWLPGHRGVDLAAASGQPVRSPTAGRVTYAGTLAGRGVVVVAHEGGLRSTFEPVVTAAGVGVGTAVARGQVVGVVTSTAGHCAPRVCLHWGVLRGETYLDPLGVVGRARIILLPLAADPA